ncbi:MAG: hypothetical protein QOF78_3677 [Phycisphaerales bacterium]|nr:hypothetical protein [Phycisphaerales bacterium]
MRWRYAAAAGVTSPWYDVDMSTLAYPHIEISDDGHVRIAGTATKVVMLVMQQLAHHWDAEELRRQHPHLTMAQIHSALAYYYDHQEEMNALIQQRIEQERDLIEQLGPSAIRVKLQTIRKVR